MHRGCRGIAYGRLLGLTGDPILPATKPFPAPCACACAESRTLISSTFAYRRRSALSGRREGGAEPEVPELAALEPSYGRHIATAPDGRARVSLPLVDPRAAIAFVLSWGDAVRVEPPELESELSQVLARAASRYS